VKVAKPCLNNCKHCKRRLHRRNRTKGRPAPSLHQSSESTCSKSCCSRSSSSSLNRWQNTTIAGSNEHEMATRGPEALEIPREVTRSIQPAIQTRTPCVYPVEFPTRSPTVAHPQASFEVIPWVRWPESTPHLRLEQPRVNGADPWTHDHRQGPQSGVASHDLADPPNIRRAISCPVFQVRTQHFARAPTARRNT
jgi:hypothetical protein